MAEFLAERHAGGITTLQLNRPARLNALAGTMREDLLAALQTAGNDPRVRVVIITGSGRGFCAGGDLENLYALLQRADFASVERLLDLGLQIVMTIRSLDKPVLAAVNGVAAGAGLNLALACDLRLAAASATFVQSFLRVGLHPDWGGSVFLPRLIGSARACELTWRAEPIDAQVAERIGLVNRVVADERLAAEAEAWGQLLVRRSPLAVALAKRSIYENMGGDLPASLEREKQAQLQCMRSAEAQEGIAAFLEKREPHWGGP